MNRSRAEYDDLTPGERAARLSRAGAPALGVEMDVDAEGEVLARGNVVIEGYWEQPEATAAAIVDGWFHTGDGGSIDDEGYLTISDRKKDVIITGGENVSSIEVEDCLFSHPAVAEVAVIGVPDEKWGETVMALVVLAPGAVGDRAGPHRPLPSAAGALQVPDVDRVPRRARPHGHRQAAEVQAPRALLGGARAPRELTGGCPVSGLTLGSIATRACGPTRSQPAPRGARGGPRARDRRDRPALPALRGRRQHERREHLARVGDPDDRSTADERVADLGDPDLGEHDGRPDDDHDPPAGHTEPRLRAR